MVAPHRLVPLSSILLPWSHRDLLALTTHFAGERLDGGRAPQQVRDGGETSNPRILGILQVPKKKYLQSSPRAFWSNFNLQQGPCELYRTSSPVSVSVLVTMPPAFVQIQVSFSLNLFCKIYDNLSSSVQNTIKQARPRVWVYFNRPQIYREFFYFNRPQIYREFYQKVLIVLEKKIWRFMESAGTYGGVGCFSNECGFSVKSNLQGISSNLSLLQRNNQSVVM